MLSFAIITGMQPYSHYCVSSVKTSDYPSDAEMNRALKYTGLGSGLGAGGGLISALLLESLKNPEEAQYLRRALQGAGIGALAGGGLGATFAIHNPDHRGDGQSLLDFYDDRGLGRSTPLRGF